MLRDRDTDDDASLDERLYGLQDANWNVTGVINAHGDSQERYSYSAYGLSAVLTAAFNSRSDSQFSWEVRSSGYHWDEGTWLQFARNRILSVVTGSWLTRDPNQYYDGLHLYHYCHSSPLVCSDPFGPAGPPSLVPSLYSWVIEKLGGFAIGDTAIVPGLPTPPILPLPGGPWIIGPSDEDANSGLPVTTLLNYGHYCGPTRRATCDEDEPDFTPPLPKPIDLLDLACAKHDCCLRSVPRYCITPIHKECNKAICAAVLAPNVCKNSPKPKECATFALRAGLLRRATIENTMPLP